MSSSQTSGLADGETVNLHVDAKPGQVVYGFDAYQCKGGTTYQYDYDILPSWSGKCVTHPLSPNAQDFVEVASTAPFKSADGTFRVGVGTTSYQTRDGKTAVITCGPHDPCYLVLKLQFQNGYGFEAIPLEFKG